MILVLISAFLVGAVYSDYDCLCNYNVEKSVLSSPSNQGQPIGYLYEFDCKEILGDFSSSQTWATIAFEHTVGYIEKDSQISSQICPGDPPLPDRVTTVATAIMTTKKTTTTSATPSTTMKPSTTTSFTVKPTTTSTSISSPPPTTSSTMKASTASTTETTMKPTTTITTMIPTTMKTTTLTTKPTTLKTSTLPTTVSAATTTVPTTTVNATSITSTTTTTSAATVTTSTTSPSAKPASSSTTVSTGKLVCPLNVQQAALAEGSLVFVNDNNRKCYELMKFTRTWSFAEEDCMRKGGHLASIENAVEERLLYGYVQTYGSSTWIGLNDKNNEENFEWTSGDLLGYQNWQAGRKDPVKHFTEDCVAMDSRTGTWVDESCGDYNAYICKFDAVVDNGTHINQLTTKTYSTPSPTQTSTSSIHQTTDGNNHLWCPQNILQAASAGHETVFVSQDTGKCYEFVKTHRTWDNAENDCQQKGGHLATVSSQREEQILYKYVKDYGHATWIGLNDQNHEEHFEWSSGDPVTYHNWHAGRKDQYAHWFEDCVAMGARTGTWEDMDCLYNYFAYICEYDAVSSNQGSLPSVDGNTQLCSSTVRHLAERDNAILGQYERGCYELMRSVRVSWQHGEDMCQSRGGHLAHISNAQQQSFIQSFLSRHSRQHAVWIGLHDTQIEGAFEWTAGTSVSYTNWIPGHTSNFESFRSEDCVAFIPYKNGKWDDIPCGNDYDLGETHPILCQYSLVTWRKCKSGDTTPA